MKSLANLINVEKSKFINKNMEIYAKNKLGQYSKFLNKNPIFVTYYSINLQMSRSDVGTGGIESELGENSPIRFNKITNFPVYNIPELRPDMVFDEAGMDIELDISDAWILPNTIKPKPVDYMILHIPGAKEILFRVNNLEYNTIQSNDFYTVSLDIKDIGDNLEETRMKGQIIETYQTIFENIGTQDRCFIKTEDIDKLNVIVKTFNELKDLYINVFYNKIVNSFLLTDNYPCHCNNDVILYDPYLEKFISESNIYYENNTESALVLTPNDIMPPNFDYTFTRTLWYAVLNRTTDYLNKYNYWYQSPITKPLSTFKIHGFNVNSVKVLMAKSEIPIDDSMLGFECDHKVELNLGPYVPCAPVTNAGLRKYVNPTLIDDLIANEFTGTDYLDEIIYKYMKDIPMEIEKNKLIPYTFDHDMKTFSHLPIVMYIIIKRYDEYFRTEAEI